MPLQWSLTETGRRLRLEIKTQCIAQTAVKNTKEPARRRNFYITIWAILWIADRRIAVFADGEVSWPGKNVGS